MTELPNLKDALFILLGLWTVGCGMGVVFSKNPVYSAFTLILSIFGLSGLYILWNSTFIAMVQILIYAGAIVVLFVFVVMLLDLGWSQTFALSHHWFSVAIAGAASWFFALVILRLLNRGEFVIASAGKTADLSLRGISTLLFNEYLWPFEVLSVFLLALIVSIYMLTRPEKNERSI